MYTDRRTREWSKRKKEDKYTNKHMRVLNSALFWNICKRLSSFLFLVILFICRVNRSYIIRMTMESENIS